MFGFSVAEHVGSFEHPSERVERNDPVTRLVLAPTYMYELLDEIDVASSQMFDLDDRRDLRVISAFRCRPHADDQGQRRLTNSFTVALRRLPLPVT